MRKINTDFIVTFCPDIRVLSVDRPTGPESQTISRETYKALKKVTASGFRVILWTYIDVYPISKLKEKTFSLLKIL